MTKPRPIRPAGRPFALFALSAILIAGTLSGCTVTESVSDAPAPTQAATATADPFLWLEEVTSDKALDWVRAQNARSKSALTKDDLFQALYDDALAILGNEARIPYGNISSGHVYNFWQDTQHVRGLWRRMPLADYAAGGDRWEVLLDVDALAKAEDRNWIFGGAQCLPPAHDPCMIRLSDGGTDAAIFREYSVAERAFVTSGFRVPEAKGSVQWIDADTLLVATNFGAGTMTQSGYPAQARVWTRGTPLSDAVPFVAGELGDVGLFPFTLRDGDNVYPGVVQGLTFFEYRVHVGLGDGRTVVLPLPRRIDLVGMVNGQVIVHL
ncbi:MAG: S9 family peptidase, partial [Pseudomonadota bacterium]